MTNRRADSVLFGFDFQSKAAMILILENIKSLHSVRLEGNEEDIELTLDNNRKILAQAKAVVNSSYDFNNVRKNLKKALISLSEGAQKTNAEKLVFITNSPNPLNESHSKNIFGGGLPTRRSFLDLPPTAKEIVRKYIKDIENPLDLEKFIIQTFQFETDDPEERNKVVKQAINDFIGRLDISASYGLGEFLMNTWSNDIFVNGTKKDVSIELYKKDIVWPILVHETKITNLDNDKFKEQFDIGVYEEVVLQYENIINSYCESIELFTKIIYDYAQFKPSTKIKQMEKCSEFIDNMWESYKSESFFGGIDNEELSEALIKIIIYNVIRRRFTIDKVKKAVNLWNLNPSQ